MNEELKIIIKAVNDEAKKNIAEVKNALNDVEGEASQVDKAMKGMAKGIAVAIGAFTAITAAIVNLGKKSMEFQKNYNRLISGFQSTGSTVQQATETYKQLYRFLGEADTATEAANLLAQITTNTEDLAEWTTILQGVYAKFPSSIPVESLAEAANETAKVGVVTGTLADAYNWLGVSEDAVNEKLATMNTYAEREAFLRSTLNSLYGSAASIYERNNQAMLAYNESQVAVDTALAEATKYVIPLLTQLNNLAAVLLQVLKPAFETIVAVVIVFVQWITAAVRFIGNFFGMFESKGSTAGEAIKDTTDKVKTSLSGATSGATGLGNALGNAAKQAKELKKQTMGFDELNVVSSQTETSTSGGGSSIGTGGAVPSIEIPEIDTSSFGFAEFEQTLKDVEEELKGILVLVGLTAGGFLLWKLGSFVSEINSARILIAKASAEGALFSTKLAGEEAQDYIDGLKGKLQTMGGTVLIVAGAILLAKGYSDAWANGIDWGNFAMILGGIALIVGGIALAFGSFAAALALAIGGVAMIVIGIKDLISNGYSMKAVIMVAIGVITALIGVIWAMNAALLANPITWVVVAIVALVAAFVVLWNECEGFRNFWISLWDNVKKLFAQFVDSIKPLINAIVGAFKEAWELIKVIWNNYLVPLFEAAWEVIKAVWNAVKPYFELIWNNIKVIFSVVKDVLSGYFKAAWEIIKAVWNTVVGYFTAIWNTIRGIFAVVKSVLSGDWQGAWDAIKGIVNTWKDYFATVWQNIKNVFNAVKTFFTTSFSSAWEGIKSIFNNCKAFFSNIWSGIKGAFGAVGDWFKNTFKNAWEGVKNVFSSGGQIFSGIKDGISSVFKTVVNKIISGINTVIAVPFKAINGMLNKIRDTGFLGITPFKSLWGESPLAVPQIPMLAKGGIVDSATLALIGERGKEAVLPLEGNNASWMDTLADRIANRSNTPSRIVLMLDGKELGYAAINSINGITKQTGSLQLALV